jgi:GNAT superfamily N-acetyltransferase
MEPERHYHTAYGSLTMRPERPEDDAFLVALFRSHTARPLRQAGLPDAAIETMTAFQYRSASGTHRAMFPKALYSIIESEGAPIGRLIEADEGDTVYYVDFALLPERQAQGLGTAFIIQVSDEWARHGKAARVEVLKTNVHSLKLCANVGLIQYADLGNGYVGLKRAIPQSLKPLS